MKVDKDSERFNTVPVVIPAYEPGELFVELCKSLIEVGFRDIVVVDDGSGEEYRNRFDEMNSIGGVIVLRHAVNMGKGRALKTAFNHVLNEIPDAIGCVSADADGQHTVDDICKIAGSLMEDDGSLILGTRDFDKSGVPRRSIMGNKVTRTAMRYMCGVSCTDTQTGLRGIPVEFMKRCLMLKGERFEYETHMLVATKGVVDIREISIETVYESEQSHKSHFKTFSDSLLVAKVIGKEFFRFVFSSLSSTVIDLAIFQILCMTLRNTPEIALSYILVATVIARLISSIYNYILNYKFVFKSQSSRGVSVVKYTALVVVQMLLSAALVTFGVWLTGTSAEIIVKMVVDTTLFFVTYKIQAKFVF